MLHDFLTTERVAILERAMTRATSDRGALQTSTTIEEGWAHFYDELIILLKRDLPFAAHSERGQYTVRAEQKGEEYMRLGYTISEVVHSYGIICQAITSCATDRGFQMTMREFQQLNLSLDTAIAEAVTAYERAKRTFAGRVTLDQLGGVAQELRSCLLSAMLSLEMLETGSVSTRGDTARVLESSLHRMGRLIDTALTNIRLNSELEGYFEPANLLGLLEETGITSGFEALARSVSVQLRVDPSIALTVDRHLFIALISNILHIAVSHAPTGGVVELRARSEGDSVKLEIRDPYANPARTTIDGYFSEDVNSNESLLSTSDQVSKLLSRNRAVMHLKSLAGLGCIIAIEFPSAV